MEYQQGKFSEITDAMRMKLANIQLEIIQEYIKNIPVQYQKHYIELLQKELQSKYKGKLGE